VAVTGAAVMLNSEDKIKALIIKAAIAAIDRKITAIDSLICSFLFLNKKIAIRDKTAIRI